MSIASYDVSVLSYEDCPIRFTPSRLIHYTKCWRTHHSHRRRCTKCRSKLNFESIHFTTCCQRFYHKKYKSYPVTSIAVQTPGWNFALPCFLKYSKKCGIDFRQNFLVIPDPIFWQIPTTLIIDKIMKLVSGKPTSLRSKVIPPPEKSNVFYRQLIEAPQNHSSYAKRSCGKNTFIRQYVYGKRCNLAMRGTISADSSLEPGHLRVPERLAHLLGQHVLVNRMPSLQPENVVALLVTKTWEHDCFGLPLEILESLHADFDGDEINIWIFENYQSRAECAFLMCSKYEMGSKTVGLKLAPCQDMLVAFYLFYDEIDFLPYKDPDLKTTFRAIYDLWGSAKTYECFDAMRLFYLRKLNEVRAFTLTLKQVKGLIRKGKKTKTFEEFEKSVTDKDGDLVIQVKSKAKGSIHHLYQMVKCVGPQDEGHVESSYWKGLGPWEAVLHAKTSHRALLQSAKIWEPGYSYSKNVFNLQGLHVDYTGRLMDGRVVIEKSVLNTMSSSLILSDAAFVEIVKTNLTI